VDPVRDQGRGVWRSTDTRASIDNTGSEDDTDKGYMHGGTLCQGTNAPVSPVFFLARFGQISLFSPYKWPDISTYANNTGSIMSRNEFGRFSNSASFGINSTVGHSLAPQSSTDNLKISVGSF
jgi:hypothetical protein